jgi:hypothetical protein
VRRNAATDPIRIDRPRRRAAIAIAATAGLAVLAAGCGGSGAPGAASAPTTPSGALAFARCMRSRGVPSFPDPTSSGQIPKPLVVAARNTNPSRFDAANAACRHLLPEVGSPQGQTITAADQADYLHAAACMRRHGFPGFPDPTFPNGGVTAEVPASIDQDSARFKRAAATCTRLIPAGLPYSSSGAP